MVKYLSIERIKKPLGGIINASIKNNIDSRLGNNVKVIYNGSRNKKEEYSGVISETYNYIFIIKTNGDEVKSFSYRDVLTNTIELFFDKV